MISVDDPYKYIPHYQVNVFLYRRDFRSLVFFFSNSRIIYINVILFVILYCINEYFYEQKYCKDSFKAGGSKTVGKFFLIFFRKILLFW